MQDLLLEAVKAVEVVWLGHCTAWAGDLCGLVGAEEGKEGMSAFHEGNEETNIVLSSQGHAASPHFSLCVYFCGNQQECVSSSTFWSESASLISHHTPAELLKLAGELLKFSCVVLSLGMRGAVCWCHASSALLLQLAQPEARSCVLWTSWK